MGSRRKDENNRVSTLLTDTITLLCKNGLTFKKNLKVQGLLGITVDDDEVFIVHLNETLGNLVSASVPENETEQRLSSRNSENGQRTPKRKRRRKSTDSQSSAKSPRQDSVIDLDLDVEIKTEPDMIVVDEVKFEGLGHQQTSSFSDEGLNFAVSSITTPNPNIASGSGGTIGGQFNSGATTMTNSSGVRPAGHPYATALVPNVADTSNQSSVGGSFQWDSNAAQGVPGMSNWASQITQQTMSQSDMSQQPGPSQGYSPGQRTGTNSKYAWDPNCLSCQHFLNRKRLHALRCKLKRQGVPQSELPVMTETIEANRNCLTCIKRLAYKRVEYKNRTRPKNLTPKPDGFEQNSS